MAYAGNKKENIWRWKVRLYINKIPRIKTLQRIKKREKEVQTDDEKEDKWKRIKEVPNCGLFWSHYIYKFIKEGNHAFNKKEEKEW